MNRLETSAQQRRENPEPREQDSPVPWAMLVLSGALVLFGIVYILLSDANTPGSWGDGRVAAELVGERHPANAKADGAALYGALCAACHQASGQGLPGVFPPLAGSEWVLGKPDTVAAIVLHGATGPLTVRGTVYNGVMPAFKDQLGDAELAALLSHLRGQWGNQAEPVAAETVAAVRAQWQERAGPFQAGKDLPSHE
ncbi:c-type cytochrome [Pseudorhodoferax sp.]|uniref:c-type cytochrome n=1 Tax=Pseudorhodoferax sp. TaxID=1993553 RepID=UPI002DD66FC6|nr:c-type cytochrome [Pseudorhodoferax sp.]